MLIEHIQPLLDLSNGEVECAGCLPRALHILTPNQGYSLLQHCLPLTCAHVHPAQMGHSI